MTPIKGIVEESVVRVPVFSVHLLYCSLPAEGTDSCFYVSLRRLKEVHNGVSNFFKAKITVLLVMNQSRPRHSLFTCDYILNLPYSSFILPCL
jgi:hypothetical protein